MFVLSDKVLESFRSYLEQRSQRVPVHGIDYLTFNFYYLGPLVFTMYTRPLGIIAPRYGIKYHLYSDDTQLYTSLDPNNEFLLFFEEFRTLYC